MKIDINKVKIAVTVPSEYVDKIRNAVCESGAGIIGNYTYCSMSTKCIGSFKPTDEANPYIGKKNTLEFVEEENLDVLCDVSKVKEIIKIIKEVHPYEEPAICIIPVLDENLF